MLAITEQKNSKTKSRADQQQDQNQQSKNKNNLLVKKEEPSAGSESGVQPIPVSTLPSQSSPSSSEASAIMHKAEDAEDEWMFHLRNKQMDEEKS